MKYTTNEIREAVIAEIKSRLHGKSVNENAFYFEVLDAAFKRLPDRLPDTTKLQEDRFTGMIFNSKFPNGLKIIDGFFQLPDDTKTMDEAVSDSYIVFEDSQEQEGLIQLSVTLPTLERSRDYVKEWKIKKLYIYKLVE
jgi:hypothetical protein